MKQLLPFLIATIFSFSAFSQFTALPVEGSRWSMQADLWTAQSNESNTEGYSHEINGDTIINDLSYKKVYFQNRWSVYTVLGDYPDYEDDITSENYTTAPLLIGAMRIDTPEQKIYYIPLDESYCMDSYTFAPPLFEEVLLFDFGVELGDTLYMFSQEIVNQIDTVTYIDGIPRKRINNAYIEGLGTNNGLFDRIALSASIPIYCNLSCFSINGDYLVGDQFYGCDSIAVVATPVVHIDKRNSIKIYPNPFENVLRIDLRSSDQQQHWELKTFDQLGRLQVAQPVTNYQSLSLSTHDWGAGVYYIALLDGDRILNRQKLVKLP